MDDLSKVSHIAAHGMKAQAKRLRVVSENLANAESLAKTPGGEPYRRKLVTFKNELERDLDTEVVRVRRTERDMSDFGRRYNPSHPAADADGYVLTPNVNPLIEVMDMREAQRSYEANMHAVTISREMVGKTLELLR
ncbi:flagellar basal body rod protein FlgC [Novispirillum sp. DQ9]|uniref:flagellar basal body rod protein FlgC n=1 Tax=Novispirillum sp. DQ9 TaxID=3398612 RepID=UPI003C7CC07D